MHYPTSTVFLTMQIIQAAKAIVPEFHAFSDDDKRYHIGATWVSDTGLKDHHNLELRYTRNSESLALKGDVQPDGSFKYVEPNGSEHIMTAERVKWFMQQTHRQALVMNQMLTKLEQSGTATEVIDALTAPA
jgi:hypothetical protein